MRLRNGVDLTSGFNGMLGDYSTVVSYIRVVIGHMAIFLF